MRLVIISNRLPLTLSIKNGKINYQPSSGGLATGISSFLEKDRANTSLWIGWPGISEEESRKSRKSREIIDTLLTQNSCYPVFINQKIMNKFYEGFCNKTIWPLFHYFPYLTSYDEDLWENYQHVNELFSQKIESLIGPDDLIWIHDYHLMLLPEMIKKRFPYNPVGFFLHIPFPSYEIFRLLPRRWEEKILQGLCGADLVGFHTYDYTQYFLRCVLRILGYENNLGVIRYPERLVKADTFPMGIDFDKFYENAVKPDVIQQKNEICGRFKDCKIVFSVDRQDYTKGILKRLEGFQLLLEKYPEWRNKIVLIMVIVPSRIGVKDYMKIQNRINELIGQINGKFGNIHWSPLIYQYKTIHFDQLCALYSACDAALITPLRDGMNLVAKEFVASRHDQKGVLILSEMAGAAMELGEALIINPNSREEIADAIKQALTMDLNEQNARMCAMQERLKIYTVNKWVQDFLSEILEHVEKESKKQTLYCDDSQIQKIVSRFFSSQNRVLFLDYDGTLVPFAKTPKQAAPTAEVRNILKKLSEMERLDLVLISGRLKTDLQEWFGNFDITLVAEHGAWVRKKGGVWGNPQKWNNSWKNKLYPLLATHRDRLPGSFIEEKTYGLVWHYRKSEQELASLRALEFFDEAISFTANLDIQVIQGNKIIELRNSGINKGQSAYQFLSDKRYDFILTAGDDQTDEDLFRVMPDNAFTIKVGLDKSGAHYYVHSHQKIIHILYQLIS